MVKRKRSMVKDKSPHKISRDALSWKTVADASGCLFQNATAGYFIGEGTHRQRDRAGDRHEKDNKSQRTDMGLTTAARRHPATSAPCQPHSTVHWSMLPSQCRHYRPLGQFSAQRDPAKRATTELRAMWQNL